MSLADMKRRFNHHTPDPEAVRMHETVRTRLRRVAESFDILLPDSREKSLAITKLEEAMFWANAAIARKDASEPPLPTP